MIHNLFIDLCTYIDGGVGYKKGSSPTPPQPTILSAWRMLGNSIVVGGGSSDINLPDGYQLCEYLESHGTEYINFGYSTPYRYKLKFQNLDNKSLFLISNGTSAAQYIGINADGVWYLGGGVTFHTGATEPTDVDVTFTSTSISAIIDGVTQTRTGTAVNVNFSLFSSKESYRPSARVWAIEVYDADTLVHHFIPCLDVAGVPCMYDAIDKKPLYNNGTGTFGYKLAESKQILSCGDLGEDDKYHVLIKADSKVIDIPLDEPLRKVGNVADTMEFPTDTPNTARVTRRIKSMNLSNLQYRVMYDNTTGTSKYVVVMLPSDAAYTTKLLCDKLSNEYNAGQIYNGAFGIANRNDGNVQVGFPNVKTTDDYYAQAKEATILYELAEPTTSYISVPSIPLAKAYSSENRVPYSEFSYENPNALYIDGEPMTDGNGNEIAMNID